MRTILSGMLAAVLVAAYFLAPVPGGVSAFHPTGSEGTATTGKMENGTARRSAAIPPIDGSLPELTETATFALSWFWGPDSRFGSLPGVLRTRVGDTGGSTEKPTYHNLGNHIETFEVDFDPSVISYGKKFLSSPIELEDGAEPRLLPWMRTPDE